MRDSFIDYEKSVLQRLHSPEWDYREIEVLVKRDDLLHPEVSGNKWRKLEYNIAQAFHTKAAGIFTFGGAYSNHLLATAFAARETGFKAIGFVRGDELTEDSNETLKRCSELGMELRFLSRERYALRADKAFIDALRQEHRGFYPIPEGGGNYYGIVGCQSVWKELPKDAGHIFVAQGTTTTSCGILAGLPEHTQLHVVPVLKGFDSAATMRQHLQGFLFDEALAAELVSKVHIHDAFHFGGYAKTTPELLDFIHEVKQQHALPLDQVYTGKAFYAMQQVLKDPQFDAQKVIFLHTGGLRPKDYEALPT